jgi:hypothetical protein
MIFSVIICDGCSIEGKADGVSLGRWRARTARYELERAAWTTEARTGVDYCPDCNRSSQDQTKQEGNQTDDS